MPPNICRSTKLVADTIDEKFDCASFNDIVESIFDFSDTPVQYRETQFIKIELPSIIFMNCVSRYCTGDTVHKD